MCLAEVILEITFGEALLSFCRDDAVVERERDRKSLAEREDGGTGEKDKKMQTDNK